MIAPAVNRGASRRLLLVAWLFPPHWSVGGRRPYRFAAHLPSYDWGVTVLTGRRPAGDLDDWPLPPEVRVVDEYNSRFLADLEAQLARFRIGAPVAASEGDAPQRLGAWDRVRAAVEDWAHDWTPTELAAVHLPSARRAARRILSAERHDAVLTTSYPYSAHVLGIDLHRRYGLPLIVDLRDPWTLNFVHDRKHAPVRRLERRLERAAFAAAARVIVTTENLANRYREIYPDWADKFVVIRNSFTPFELPPAAPERGPIRLVHFGHIYRVRSMSVLYRALAELRDRVRLRPGDLVLENYGRLGAQDREEIVALGLQSFVSVRDPLPYAEGICMLRRAHALLLPTFGTDRSSLFLPGKLYDYLLAGRPILAFSTNPELSSIITRTGTGRVLAPDDLAATRAAIGELLDGSTEQGFRPVAEEVAKFTAAGAAGTLARVLNEVTAR